MKKEERKMKKEEFVHELHELARIKFIADEIGSGTTPDSKNELYYDGNYNWIQSGDIYNRDKIYNTEKKITESAINDIKMLKLFKKDFIIFSAVLRRNIIRR